MPNSLGATSAASPETTSDVSGQASAQRVPLSAVVVAMNEEDNIEACLASLDFCEERLVVDSHSTDRTRELAAAMGARVIERDWPGFGPQKRFGAEAAQHDWVLCIDADERVSPALRSEIERERAGGFAGRVGYDFPWLSKYLGRWIRHGSWYPNHTLKLFDRRHGNYNEALIHEKVKLHGSVGRLQGDLLHLPYRNLEQHLAKISRYTTEMAEKAWEQGKRARWYHLLLHPAWRFFKFYVLQAGFRDGWQGFLLACITAHYTGMKYVKLYAMSRRAWQHEEDPRAFDRPEGSS